MSKRNSIVEGKHDGWFIRDDKPPELEFIDSDLDQDDKEWGVSWKKLGKDLIGYALGRGGDTRIKLQIASGCVIQYVGHWAAFGGTAEDQNRGRKYLEWLLEQQDGDTNVDVHEQQDVKVLWVPESSVGYVTGVKAGTLRNLETKTGTFCFFLKRNTGNSREKMVIFSWRRDYRESAAQEVEQIVDFHQRKIRSNDRVTYHTPSPSRSKSRRSRSHSSSRSRSRSKSRSRSRSDSSRRSRSRSARRVKREEEK